MSEELSYEENERRYNAVLEWLKNMPVPEFVEWWGVENTGWSAGQSWFRTGGTSINPLRFYSEEEAREYALKEKQAFDDPNTKWRYLHTTIMRKKNKSVTTVEWTEV